MQGNPPGNRAKSFGAPRFARSDKEVRLLVRLIWPARRRAETPEEMQIVSRLANQSTVSYESCYGELPMSFIAKSCVRALEL